MTAQTKTVSIQEPGLDVQDSSKMLFKILDDQINNYKLRFISDWEGNHNISSEEKNRKIERLKLAKDNLRNFLKDFDSRDVEVNLSLNLEVNVKSKEHSPVQEEELLVS